MLLVTILLSSGFTCNFVSFIPLTLCSGSHFMFNFVLFLPLTWSSFYWDPGDKQRRLIWSTQALWVSCLQLGRGEVASGRKEDYTYLGSQRILRLQDGLTLIGFVTDHV